MKQELITTEQCVIVTKHIVAVTLRNAENFAVQLDNNSQMEFCYKGTPDVCKKNYDAITGILKAYYAAEAETQDEAEDEAKTERDRMLDTPIRELHIEQLIPGYLEEDGIVTLRDLSKITKKECLKIRGMGKKTVKRLEEALNNLGLSFAEPIIRY